jgi:hypothetical protein
VVKGQRTIIIAPEDGSEPREYSLPRGVHVSRLRLSRAQRASP